LQTFGALWFQEELNTSERSESADKGDLTATELLIKKKKKEKHNTLSLSLSLSPVEAELEVFFQMPLMSSDADGNSILDWWKEHQDRLPTLAKFVRKYYAVPASSATSERTFSCLFPFPAYLSWNFTRRQWAFAICV
jgi:hypothetical protein